MSDTYRNYLRKKSKVKLRQSVRHVSMLNDKGQFGVRYIKALLTLKLNIDGTDIILINVYGPNREDSNFCSVLENLIKQYEHETLRIGGDYNTIINSDKDKKNGLNHTNKNNKQQINSLMTKYDLNDIWRIFNPELNLYTWHSSHKPPIFCRLDYF